MPKNFDLKPVTFPMKLRFGEEPTTEFKNDLEALRVELIDFPHLETARDKVHRFVNATWEDEPSDTADVPEWQKYRSLEMALQFKALPTVLETLSFTFLIAGIDLQTVTHLIRHRTGSFSAQCTGDRWQSHSSVLVPGSIQNSPELYERWKKHVEEAKKLYADMIDTRKISIMDARTILPRAIETHYYAHFNLKDLVAFLNQRFDKQIQPCVDNLISYKMLILLAEKMPEILTVVNPHAASRHYISTARTGKATNLYFPDKDSDKFDWHPHDFIYQGERDEVNGTDPELGKRENFKFTEFQKKCDERVRELSAEYADWKRKVGFQPA